MRKPQMIKDSSGLREVLQNQRHSCVACVTVALEWISKNFFKCSSGDAGTHIRKQRETFQALGKAEILNGSDFFSELFPFSTSRFHWGRVVLATFEAKPQEASQFCQHSHTACSICCFCAMALHSKCLTTLQVLPLGLILCPLPTHTERTHTREGQSSSPSADGSEGK